MDQRTDQAEPSIPTFRIPECNLEAMEERLTKYNRRAKRLGMAPLTSATVAREEIPRFICRQCRAKATGEIAPAWIEMHRHHLGIYEDGKAMYSEPVPMPPKVFLTIEVHGSIPKIEGWTFVASIDFEETGVILRSRPGEDTPEQYRNLTEPRCEHCNKIRRRKNTFVIRNTESGETKLVGRACLQDFLRSADVNAALEWLEFERSLTELGGDPDADDEGWGGGSRYNPPIPTVTWLAASHAMIRTFGYVTKKDADFKDTTSTAGRTEDFLFPPRGERRWWDEAYGSINITDRDKERALACVAWVRTELRAENDFTHNLKTLMAEQEYERKIEAEHPGSGMFAHSFNAKYMGFVTAAMGSYLREQDTLAERQRKAFKNEHIGNLKERGEMLLTLEAVRWFEGDPYGRDRGLGRAMMRFVDEEGHILIWWTSRVPTIEVDGEATKVSDLEGFTFRAKATVAKHGEYKGVAQTRINRVTVLAVVRTHAENEIAKGQALKEA